MSGVSLPVTRPSGRALLVSNPATRPQAVESLGNLGFACGEADEPYAAMVELCRRPQAYRAVILSLASLYREELSIIRAIKRRFPQAEVWLTHTDGRQGAMAEAMRLGADGLIDDEGLHRIAMNVSVVDEAGLERAGQESGMGLLSHGEHARPRAHSTDDDESSNEPILSPDELRALLQEQPSIPPAGGDEG